MTIDTTEPVTWNHSNYCGAVTATATIGRFHLVILYDEMAPRGPDPYGLVADGHDYEWAVYARPGGHRYGDTPESCGSSSDWNAAREAAEASGWFYATHAEAET
jgi:hypothetical protein